MYASNNKHIDNQNYRTDHEKEIKIGTSTTIFENSNTFSNNGISQYIKTQNNTINMTS